MTQSCLPYLIRRENQIQLLCPLLCLCGHMHLTWPDPAVNTVIYIVNHGHVRQTLIVDETEKRWDFYFGDGWNGGRRIFLRGSFLILYSYLPGSKRSGWFMVCQQSPLSFLQRLFPFLMFLKNIYLLWGCMDVKEAGEKHWSLLECRGMEPVRGTRDFNGWALT